MWATNRRNFLFGLAAIHLSGRAHANEFQPRVQVDAETRLIIEGGLKHHLADTVFEVTDERPKDRVGLEIGDFAEIDVLRVRLRPGVTKVDRFIWLGEGAKIGLIDVEAADQTDAHDEMLDGFVQIRRADVSVGAMRFKNIDRCIMAREAKRLWIGSIECESYSKALKIDHADSVYVGALRTRVISPKAGTHLGYSCLTIADSQNVTFPLLEIEDAAAHAVYVAGGGGREFSQGIHFGSIISRRSRGCGFKCKASLTASQRVSIDHLMVFDAGFGREHPGSGDDALRVENCAGFRVGVLDARRAETPYSCYSGVFLDGATDFSLGRGYVANTFGPMVRVEDDRKTPNRDILISDLSGSDIGADGYRIRHSHNQILERMIIVGGTLQRVKGDALRIRGSDGLATKPNFVRLDSVGETLSSARQTEGGQRSVKVEVTETGN